MWRTGVTPVQRETFNNAGRMGTNANLRIRGLANQQIVMRLKLTRIEPRIVNAPKQHATAQQTGRSGWAPRLAQESRLRQLEELIARRGTEIDAGDTEIERAVLLGALDRRQDAQQAFIDILRRAPTNFSALNEFGTLLTNMGAIDAACRVYSEAILHHPQNPMGHVNLANLLLRANKYDQARAHYEAALRIDPDYAQAHQGLGAVLSDTGDRAGARYHFHKGFRDHAISSLPYRGTEPPIASSRVLCALSRSMRGMERIRPCV